MRNLYACFRLPWAGAPVAVLTALMVTAVWKFVFVSSPFDSIIGCFLIFLLEVVVWAAWPIWGGGGFFASVFQKHKAADDE